LKKSVAKRVAAARGFIFDMDGTLILGSASGGGFTPLPGAVDLIARLRERGTPFRVFTNGTAKIPAAYAETLRGAGLDVRDDEMMTPATSAAAWFVAHEIKRVRALGAEGLQTPLREAGIDVVGPQEKAEGVEAVFTGWYKEFSLADMERACNDIWAGAMMTSSSNVPFFATSGGRAIGHSFAINAAIKSLTGKKARVLGKPSRDAFFAALSLMGLPKSAAPEIVVVGDDPALEMRLAKNAGAMGIAVTTGIQTRATLSKLHNAETPDVIEDGLLPILEALNAA
jgi:HAD superfamily hydrolase (TIGR01450 family)